MAIVEKQVMVVGIDDKENNTFALDWTLKQFFTPFASNPIFRLVIVQAKPSPAVSKPGISKYVNMHYIYKHSSCEHTCLHARNGYTYYIYTYMFIYILMYILNIYKYTSFWKKKNIYIYICFVTKIWNKFDYGLLNMRLV